MAVLDGKDISSMQRARVDSYAKEFFGPLERAKEQNGILIPQSVESYQRSVYEEAVSQYNKQAGRDMLRLDDVGDDSGNFVLACNPDDLADLDNNVLSCILCRCIVSHPDVYENTPEDVFYQFVRNETEKNAADGIPDTAAYYFVNGFPVKGTFSFYEQQMENDPMYFYLSAKVDIKSHSDVLDAYLDFEDEVWKDRIAVEEGMRKKHKSVFKGQMDNVLDEEAQPDDVSAEDDKDASAGAGDEPQGGIPDDDTPDDGVDGNDFSSLEKELRHEYAAADLHQPSSKKPNSSRPISKTARIDMGKPDMGPDDGIAKRIKNAFTKAGSDVESQDGTVSQKGHFARVFGMVSEKTKPMRDAFRQKMHERMDTVRACASAGYQVYKARKFASRVSDYSVFLEKHGHSVSDIQDILMQASQRVGAKQPVRDDVSAAFDASSAKNDLHMDSRYGVDASQQSLGFREKMHRRMGDLCLGFKAAYAQMLATKYDNKIAGYQAKRDKLNDYLSPEPVRNRFFDSGEAVSGISDRAVLQHENGLADSRQPSVGMPQGGTAQKTYDWDTYMSARIQAGCAFQAKGGIYEKIVALRDYMDYVIDAGMQTDGFTQLQQEEIGRQVFQAGRAMKRDAAGYSSTGRDNSRQGADIIDIATGQSTPAPDSAVQGDMPRRSHAKPDRGAAAAEGLDLDFSSRESSRDLGDLDFEEWCNSMGM